MQEIVGNIKHGPDLTELRQILGEMAGPDFLVKLTSATRNNRAFAGRTSVLGGSLYPSIIAGVQRSANA